MVRFFTPGVEAALVCSFNTIINSHIKIPIPNTIKLSRFPINEIVEVDTAKRTINEAGLQGSTIAPKKNTNLF